MRSLKNYFRIHRCLLVQQNTYAAEDTEGVPFRRSLVLHKGKGPWGYPFPSPPMTSGHHVMQGPMIGGSDVEVGADGELG